MFRVFERLRLRNLFPRVPKEPRKELNLKAHFTLKDMVGMGQATVQDKKANAVPSRPK